VEYRGYGDSRHLTPDEHALYADAETVLDALAARGITRDHVVLSGRSLGTGVAAEMAKRGRGAALVLLAPFSSIPDLVPALGFLVADRFATGEKAAQIGVPTLIVHGDRDEIVPFAMGVELSHAIPRATLLRVDGASHGDISDRPAVLGSIASFARVHG
jgi:pimeloyl-ACP methyl ester carboxylesterase